MVVIVTVASASRDSSSNPTSNDASSSVASARVAFVSNASDCATVIGQE